MPREKLNIEIISGEAGGFLGLFSKKAKIRASLLSLDMDFSFTDQPKAKSESKIEHREKPEKEDIPETRTENEKAGSACNFQFKSYLMSKASESKIKIEPRVKPVKKVSTEKPEEKKAPVVSTSDDSVALKAKDLLEGILQRISLECKVTVNETQEKIILGY